MPHIVLTKVKGQDHDKSVKAKILNFLSKLTEDDTSAGLHIEKMQNSVDSRARTARVDQSLRAVLYRLDIGEAEHTYVYAGTWPHDEAIERARTRKLQVNPINGIAELIEVTAPVDAPYAAPIAAAWQGEQSAAAQVAPAVSYLETRGYSRIDLVEGLGLSESVAVSLLAATDEDSLLESAERLENEWQSAAALGLAVGDSIEKIRSDLGLDNAIEDETVAEDTAPPSEDARILSSLKHPAAQMQFTFVEDDEELRRVLEDEDFGAWRVFLHPEQRKYATQNYNGPFRLSGGAGTGKTVVLLHRSRHLQEAEPGTRTVLTTFTKALAGNLQRDLERLDPSIQIATALGDTGVLVKGIDALAAEVRDRAGKDFGSAALRVLGVPLDQAAVLRSNADGWQDAIDDMDPDLPESILNPAFFEAEYLQVVLPSRVTTWDDYLSIRRPGRGVALDRKKRAALWSVVEQYRKSARLSGALTFAEVAEIGAAWLETQRASGSTVCDHVLVDEGQDLIPSHWKLLRALVSPQQNDLFIAEDSHQRIYGHHVVLSRYGIKITGRSRRLTLNYRTTEQNLQFALGVLAGVDYLDSEAAIESVAGYRSARRGPAPVLLPAKSDEEQVGNIAELIRQWIDEGVALPTIAVLARSNNQAKKVQDGLAQRGVSVTLLTSARSAAKQPVVLTMHTAKGMEFSRVVLFDVSDGTIPNQWVIKDIAPEELADALLRERSLLYVAASRARDGLVVSWKGTPSALLGIRDSPQFDP